MFRRIFSPSSSGVLSSTMAKSSSSTQKRRNEASRRNRIGSAGLGHRCCKKNHTIQPRNPTIMNLALTVIVALGILKKAVALPTEELSRLPRAKVVHDQRDLLTR